MKGLILPRFPVEEWQRDTVETLVGRVQSDGKRGWGRGHAGSWGTGESLWQKGNEGWKAEGSMSRCTCLVKSLYHVDWRMNWEPRGNKNGGMEMRKQYCRSQIRVDEYLDHVVAARVEKQWVDLRGGISPGRLTGHRGWRRGLTSFLRAPFFEWLFCARHSISCLYLFLMTCYEGRFRSIIGMQKLKLGEVRCLLSNTQLVWVHSLPLSPRLSCLPTLTSQDSGWSISEENGNVLWHGGH